MQRKHQEIIDQYKNAEKALEKSKIKTVVLEALMIIIVCYMKSIQETASLKANIIATSLVTALLCVYFWDFYLRKSFLKKVADSALEGVNLEKQYSFLKPQFFKKYLKEFNALGFIMNAAFFDILFIYFFSVSYTQLLKAMSPEIMIKLKFLTPISTLLITLSIGRVYYGVIRPLVSLKREVEA